ncbi:serine/threonine protein kinase, partial [Myxococcota bacterium]|nr:serine/threonine protein kinase [Myxococcota bacterium]
MPSTERYERLEPLGAGGMASVFRGHDRLLDRPVAIKVLHPELARRAPLRARFLREARIFAQLKHPHIVDIYDVLSEGDEVAMVMELVEGDDLKGILKRHAPLIPPLAALVIEPVAEALAYAHARGVIHRDVKPANILMGADGVVKLSDFGIAKAANQEDNLTQTGELLGTPAYIAPEQAQGAAITPAVDQYALGVVLYQLVTGEQPFKAPNTMAVLTRIVLGNYTDPRQLSPNVDEPLARIISRALKLDPQARFPDVGAFLSALAVYQAHLGAARRAALLSSLVEDPAALDARLSASLRVGGLAGPGVALLRPPSAPPPERPSAQPPAPDLTSSDVYGGESSGDVHSADRSASLSASLSGDVASRRPPRWPLALGAAALLGALALFFVAPAPPSPTAVVTPAPLDAAAPPHDALLKHDAPPDARPLDAAPSTPPPS